MTIYPEGHKGNYKLDLKKDPACMSLASFQCPICKLSFKSEKIRDIKLVPLKVSELRTQYKGIDPLYYEIVTCPTCRYSAQISMFDKLAINRKKMLADELEAHLRYLPPWGEELTPDRVFERYYLALLCYGICFRDKELLQAGIWLKLHNLYSDAKDENMALYAAAESQKSYLEAFQRLSISPMKFPSLNLRIGLLSAKIGDVQTARNFLYKVKTDINSTRLQKDAADDAVNDLKSREE